MTIFGKVLMGLILVTATVLIIRGGSGKDDLATMAEGTPNETVATEEVVPSETEFRGSLMQLVARGGDYKCTFTHTSDVSDSSGTVYVSGEKIRGDFKSVEKVSGANIESHMITDGGFSYLWSSAMSAGLKMKVNSDADATATASTTQASGSFDYNQSLDYSCQPWMVDAKMFALPANLNFTAIGV